MVEIIDFEDRYKDDFIRLNTEWLEKYGLMEAHDRRLLEDPREHIIDAGGCIFLARENNTIIGCAGLMKSDAETCELIKMTVAPGFRGRGIGRQLLDHSLREARQRQARKLILVSNHQLKEALHMYHQSGFKDVPVGDSVYHTADIRMELLLT